MPIDYKKYPPNWKSEIRPDILERDGHCCKFCGVRDKALVYRTGEGRDAWIYWPEGMQSEAWSLDGRKSVKIVLTIAHLDNDITNNEYDNLAALCQKCHNNYDKDYRKGNAKETNRKKKGLQNLF